MSNSNQGGPIIERTLKGHKDGITSLAFHPVPSELGRRKQQYSTLVQIASSSQDGGLTLWNYQPYDSEVRAFRLVIILTVITYHMSFLCVVHRNSVEVANQSCLFF